VTAGLRFCTRCGTALQPGLAAPARGSRAAASGALATLDYAAAAAFGVAAAGTLLDWVSVGSFGVSAWNGDARFRIADWLGVTAPIDAIVAVVLALAGAAAVLMPGVFAARKSVVVVAAGAGLVLLGALQVYYFLDQDLDLGNVGIGLWVVMAAGGAAVLCGVAGASQK
jgi:hypothetical protein